jgi:Protein tyrosine and serine/threonine kinase
MKKKMKPFQFVFCFCFWKKKFLLMSKKARKKSIKEGGIGNEEVQQLYKRFKPKPMEFLSRGKLHDRRLLRQGGLRTYKRNSEKTLRLVHVFLFNDYFLITTRSSSRSTHYTLRTLIFVESLDDVTQVRDGSDNSNVIKLLHRSSTPVVLVALDCDDAVSWVDDLNYVRTGCVGPRASTLRQRSRSSDENALAFLEAKEDEARQQRRSQRDSERERRRQLEQGAGADGERQIDLDDVRRPDDDDDDSDEDDDEEDDFGIEADRSRGSGYVSVAEDLSIWDSPTEAADGNVSGDNDVDAPAPAKRKPACRLLRERPPGIAQQPRSGSAVALPQLSSIAAKVSVRRSGSLSSGLSPQGAQASSSSAASSTSSSTIPDTCRIYYDSTDETGNEFFTLRVRRGMTVTVLRERVEAKLRNLRMSIAGDLSRFVVHALDERGGERLTLPESAPVFGAHDRLFFGELRSAKAVALLRHGSIRMSARERMDQTRLPKAADVAEWLRASRECAKLDVALQQLFTAPPVSRERVDSRSHALLLEFYSLDVGDSLRFDVTLLAVVVDVLRVCLDNGKRRSPADAKSMALTGAEREVVRDVGERLVRWARVKRYRTPIVRFGGLAVLQALASMRLWGAQGERMRSRYVVYVDLSAGIDASALNFSRVLGSGSFGTVFLMHLPGSPPKGEAIKRLCDPASMEMVSRELTMQTMLCHPNIVQLRGIFSLREVEGSGARATEHVYIHLVTRYAADGNLRSFFAKYAGSVSVYEKVVLARDVAAGLAYLHSCGVVHRDLKRYVCKSRVARVRVHGSMSSGKDCFAGILTSIFLF